MSFSLAEQQKVLEGKLAQLESMLIAEVSARIAAESALLVRLDSIALSVKAVDPPSQEPTL